MAAPWVDPVAFHTYYGGGWGSALGCISAALGILAVRWVPRGKHRTLLVGTFSLLSFLGFAQFCAGIYAMVRGQLLEIWYPLLLIGGAQAVVFTLLKRVVRRRYDNFELREWVNAEPVTPRLD